MTATLSEAKNLMCSKGFFGIQPQNDMEKRSKEVPSAAWCNIQLERRAMAARTISHAARISGIRKGSFRSPSDGCRKACAFS